MDSLKKFFAWLQTFPLWIRAIILFLISAFALILSMSFSSCGSTRAVVHNGAYGTSTEIKITTNNPTSVTASPNVQLKHGSLNE